MAQGLVVISNTSYSLGHPDQPHLLDASVFFEQHARISDMLSAIRELRLTPEPREFEAPLAAIEELCLVHPRDYLERFERACRDAGSAIAEFGEEFFVSRGSFDAARSAVGGAIEAVRLIARGEARHVISLCRPPGHHAEPERAMGFCGLNSAAIAAMVARELEHSSGNTRRKVFVFDLDAHHGNGTVRALEGAPDIIFAECRTVSTDAHHTAVPVRAYPYPSSYSYGSGADNVIVQDLRFGTTGSEYLAAVDAAILPAFRSFAPDITILSAGFDCMAGDPLGDLGLEGKDLELLVERFVSNGTPCVTVIEGGYERDNNRRGIQSIARALARFA